MLVPNEQDAVPNIDVTRSKLLLAEGKTPANFLEAFVQFLGIGDKIEIRDYGGIGDLPTFLKTISRTAGFRDNVTRLGITRDSENSVAEAQRKIDGAVAAADLPSNVQVSSVVLPHDRPGCIETLLLRAVQEKPVMPCVQQFMDCATSRGVVFPAGAALDKAMLQVYMSSLEKTQIHPGTAARFGAWPFESDALEELRRFLRLL